jgi:Ca2+-binding protein (EF-Hand superfamily)
MKLAIGLKSFKRLEELNIKTINTIEFFYQEFLTQDIHLNEVLKGIFESLDSDLNGNIDFDEAKTGLKKIDDSITTDQIKEYMKTIDFNKEGKISFYEFSHL